MPKAIALFGILAASALAFAGLASCSSSVGTTPGCVNNLTDAGFMYPVANGCYSFANCPMGEPKNCCVDGKGNPLTGNTLAECLYGYGACAQFTVQSEASGIVETCHTSVVTGGGGSGTGGGGSGTGGSGPTGPTGPTGSGPSGGGGMGGSSNGTGGSSG